MRSAMQGSGAVSRVSMRVREGVLVSAIALAVALGVALVGASSAQAQTLKVLHSFIGQPDGSQPFGNLLRDSSGNLYGTTYDGGTTGNGTAFKLTRTGTETVLHSFTWGTDGGGPWSGVIGDSAGNLYGTTVYGGASNSGIVFELDSAGTETILYNFAGQPDGNQSYGGLVRDAAGNLYGTTEYGGASNFGTVFKLDPAGKETVVYSFKGTPDGAQPYAGLVRDADGNLYGTTEHGGADGFGTVFKIGKTGETVLHSFSGGTDGATPEAGLIRDAADNLYGTTFYGGTGTCNNGQGLGCGTVFKVTRTGTETVLCSFTGTPDGADPGAGLARDSAGNFYGTTSGGGASGHGTVFELDAAGKETVLYSFTGGTDGGGPFAGLVLDPKGNLYGSTFEGGDLSCFAPYGCGVVFALKP